jgi:hypothetical protein
MGTRNLTVVVVNKKVKVAQYCQWDGYLSGQGKTIFDFIENKMNLTKFKKALKNCRFLNAEEIKQTWVNSGADPEDDFVSMEISDKHKALYPSLSRDTGAKILELIQFGAVTKLNNEFDFGADSLFCEFAYVLDLDNKVLEIYKGFNKGKAKGRFSKLKVKSGEDYQQVTLVKKVKFSDCNKKTLEKLIEAEEKENS